MISAVSATCLGILFLCVALNLVRLVIGPSPADRAMASDTILLNLVGIAAVYSVFANTPFYFDLALVFALLGFVATVCFAKYIGSGRIIE